jgi:hypothetical protein
MAPHETEVISALNLLRDTPSEILNIHRHLALETLTQIGRLLNAIILENATSEPAASSQSIPVHEGDSTDLPIDLPAREAHTLQNATRKRKRQTLPDGMRKRKQQNVRGLSSATLIKAVKQRLPFISKFCKDNASLSDILQNEQEMQFADKRVDHLKQVDGNKTPSEEQKLLKGLSQLSLARQFTTWETERGWKSKVDTLYNQIRVVDTEDKTAATGRAGRMTQFVRDHGYPKSDQNVVRKGIQRGITQLLFLKLVKEAFTTPAQKCAVQGILARVTIFEHALFQSISISELPTLANSLLKNYDGNPETIEGGRSDDTDITIVLEREISEWFENMTGDFEMISQTTKRGRQNSLQTTHAPHVANGSVDAYPRHDDRPSDNSGNSRCQIGAAVFPSIDSHELTTFSTLPRIDSNSQRMPLQSSFIEYHARPEEDGMLPNTGSHDLAQFSRNTNDANCVLTRNSNSCGESHDLSLFSRGPSSVLAQPHLLVPPLCSSFPGDVPSPHELSSFPTIPAA